jgi:NADH:ubiquinone oxidoreductase subunit E
MLTNEEICNVKTMTDEEKYELLDKVIIEYERKENNLIQILHMAQAIFSFLPAEVQRHIAREMDLSLSKVNSVLSFYTFFSTKPKGKYTVCVCLGTACYVRGGKEVVNKLKEMLNVEVGETSKDLTYSLEVMRCIGACGLAPAMTINGKVYKQVNPNKLQGIMAKYK